MSRPGKKEAREGTPRHKTNSRLAAFHELVFFRKDSLHPAKKQIKSVPPVFRSGQCRENAQVFKVVTI